MVLLRAYVVLDQEGVQMRDVRYFHRFDQAKVLRDEEVREASTAQLEVFPWPCARPVFCLSLPSVYIVSSNANALARLTNPAAPRDGVRGFPGCGRRDFFEPFSPPQKANDALRCVLKQVRRRLGGALPVLRSESMPPCLIS